MPERRFKNRAEFGQWLQGLRPEWGDRDPLEVARAALRTGRFDEVVFEDEFGPTAELVGQAAEGVTSLIPGIGAAGRKGVGVAARDFTQTAGETIEGMGNIVSGVLTNEQPNTLRTLARLVAGGADLALGTDLASPESEDLARQFGREFTEQTFNPGEAKRRPVRAASNLMPGLSPLRGMAKAGALGRLSKPLLRGLSAVDKADPSNIASTGIQAGIGAGRAGLRGAEQAAEAVFGRRRDVPLSTEFGAVVASLPTGMDRRVVETILEQSKATADNPDKAQRFGRQLMGLALEKPDDLIEGYARNAHKATDQVYQAAKQNYRTVTAKLKPILDQPLSAEQIKFIRDDFSARLRTFGIRLEPVDKALPDGPQRAVFSDPSPISGFANRKKLGDKIVQVVNRGWDGKKRAPHPVRDYHILRQNLDDMIQQLDPAEGASKTARSALTDMRQSLAKFLYSSLPPEYQKLMGDYERQMVFLDEVAVNLRTYPGQVRRSDLLEADASLASRTAVDQAFGDPASRSRMVPLIESLQEQSDVSDLLAQATAIQARHLGGKGLVARAAISGALTSAASGFDEPLLDALKISGGALMGGLTLSPRVVSRAMAISPEVMNWAREFAATPAGQTRIRQIASEVAKESGRAGFQTAKLVERLRDEMEQQTGQAVEGAD